MFAVYWNDAFRTTRKRLPDSGDATAVAVAVAVAHTHIQYGFRVVCTLLMAFSQYLLYHVSINGCTFQYQLPVNTQCSIQGASHTLKFHFVPKCLSIPIFESLKIGFSSLIFARSLSLSFSLRSFSFEWCFARDVENWMGEFEKRAPVATTRETHRNLVVLIEMEYVIYVAVNLKTSRMRNESRNKNIIFLLIRTF